jgi:hypothetical protein
MRARLFLIALLAALIVSAAGCAAPATPTPTGPAVTTGTPAATGSVAASGSAEMRTSNPDPSTLLTAADVQAATGMSGVTLVAPNSKPNATGRLNFANAQGDVIAILTLGDGTAFNDSLAGRNFAREATGTGDMSYVGPAETVSPVLTIFAAAKGDHAVMVKTFAMAQGGTETWLTIEQLQQLVGLALSRWPSQ